MEICKVCGKECKNFNGLASHINQNHADYNVQKYYDEFLLKEESEKFCNFCKKQLKFKRLSIGYAKYCSSLCSNKSEQTKNKYKNTMMNKYGVDNSFKSEEVKSKIKETNLKKYGSDVYIVSEDCLTKKNNTLLNKYGVDHYSKTDIFKMKASNKCYWKSNESRMKLLKIFEEKKLKTIMDRLDESLSIVSVSQDKIVLFCNNCKNEVEMSIQMLHRRYKNNEVICNDCNKYRKPISSFEFELFDFIKKQYQGIILTNEKNIIDSLELDIYLPELKLAFEFNGLYWHCEIHKDKNYHLNKTEECEKQEIHLVHIYEDDWIYKQDIVKSRILNLLGKSKKIYARKCSLEEVSYKDSKEFLEKNHIQGNCISKIRLGLYYENELVSLMTFGKLRKCLGQQSKEGLYELLRFCNKINTSVVGGANKLFKYFINNYTFSSIISYADRSWTMNNGKTLYDNLGFKLHCITQPNYYYVNKGIRENRFKYRKNVLVEQGFDVNKSEHQIMLERNIYRIYDSGSIKYEFKNKHEIIE